MDLGSDDLLSLPALPVTSAASGPPRQEIPPPPPNLVPPVTRAQMVPPPQPHEQQMESSYAPVRGFGETQPENSGHMLGFAFLASGIGAALGLTYAGVYGGIGGGLVGGALVNTLRAYRHAKLGTQVDDKEAIISGTYAVISLGVAGYLFYRSQKVHVNPKTLRIEENEE